MGGTVPQRQLVGEAARRTALAKANSGHLLQPHEIAALLGISKQTVRAIERSALKKLRAAAPDLEDFLPGPR